MTADTITRTINKVKINISKHSPELLIAAGIVGAVTSTVMACKATRKIDIIIEEHKKSIDAINTISNNTELKENNNYSDEDKVRDLAITYGKTAIGFTKLYGPSVALGVASITCILASNNIMRKRNAALGAAYTTIFNSFREYRNRVADRYGQEAERQIRYAIKAEEIEKTVTNDKGKEKKVTEQVISYDPNGISDYARIFGKGYTKAWEADPEYNMVFLKAQQSMFTNKLRSEGIVFLNDVYDALGYERTKYGQIVGWRYDEKNPVGDNFVDFGIYNMSVPENAEFINGSSNTVLLDFNVDGDVLSTM